LKVLMRTIYSIPFFLCIVFIMLLLPTPASSMTMTHNYDETGRLTSVVYTNAVGLGSINYRYDLAGNMLESITTGSAGAQLDSDNDGVIDSADAFPNDAAASVDSDGDGYPDAWNTGATQAQINASSLVLDAFPNDPLAWLSTTPDNVPPIIAPPVAISVSAVNATGIPASATLVANFLSQATATDNVGVVGGVTNNAPVTLPMGSTTITFTARDQAGNTGTATSTITVTNAAPLIQSQSIQASQGTAANFVVSASDMDSGQVLTYSITTQPASGTLSLDQLGRGVYTPTAGFVGQDSFTVTVTDPVGASATSTISVTVAAVAGPDTTAPVITLLGNATVNVVQGQTYVDAGATAQDNVDGNISNQITVINGVNSSVIGSYTVTYDVSDAAGNPAQQLVRTVNVAADVAPVMTLNGAPSLAIVQGAVYNDRGATAVDDLDGNITANIVVSNVVNSNIVGVYQVSYSVSDTAGHLTQATRQVEVIAAGGAAPAGMAVQVPLTGQAASVELSSAGGAISNFSSTASMGTPPTGVTTPFGVLSYTTTVPAGSTTQTVSITFSTPLPATFSLYKVDNAGVYTLIPNGAGVDQWVQVNATMITMTLTDGGAFDLDGIADGIIIDPVVVGVNPAGAGAGAGGGGGGGGGGGSFGSVLILLGLLLFAVVWRKRRDQIAQ